MAGQRLPPQPRFAPRSPDRELHAARVYGELARRGLVVGEVGRGTAPDHVVLVDSLSMRVAPGLTVGVAVAPSRLEERLAAALKSGGWAAGRFALSAAEQWTAPSQRSSRPNAAMPRHASSWSTTVSPASPSAPIRVPTTAGGATRAVACGDLRRRCRPARDRGHSAAAFALVPGQAPTAVRLALSAPPLNTLFTALEMLAALARGRPEDAGEE